MPKMPYPPAPKPKPTPPSRKPKKRQPPKKVDAWNRNDEKLYGIMGGKSKTKYAEDQATYREFGRTYGGPTDATSASTRKRRERGDWSFGEKPKAKKAMGKMKPIPKKMSGKVMPKKKVTPKRKSY
jgi:hypothetical protein